MEPLVRRGPSARCAGLSRRAGGPPLLTSGEVSESDRGQGRRTSGKLWTTVYELDSPAAVETKEFPAMRGWGRFAPHVRSQTRVVSMLR